MKKHCGILGRLVWSALRRCGLTRLLPTGLFLRLQYACWHGGWLRLNPPVDFNEKIQWLKLHYHNPLLRTCADKYAVREFVRQRIGEKYLNRCLGVYSSADEIDFDSLPNRFALKATLGSSWNIICTDKSKLDWAAAKREMERWLKTDFYQYGREWQYHGDNRRIVCEAFLEDPLHEDLRDYKLFTFKGVVKYIWVDYHVTDERGRKVHCRNFYDPDWNYQPDKGVAYPTLGSVTIPKPQCLEELKRLATALSADFPQCRVDFYVLADKQIVFGELTFTSFGGCGSIYPPSFADELGQYIELPNPESCEFCK